MKKILIPVDFSIEAYQALQITSRLSERMNVWIYLLSVSSSSKEDAERMMKEWMGSELFHNVNMTPIYLDSLSIDAIQQVIHEHELDMIVSGIDSVSESNNLFKSGMADLVNQLEIPVLVIKENDLDFWPKKVVFASTFYGEIDKVFFQLKLLAQLFDSEIHLLKIVTPGEYEKSADVLRQIDRFAKDNRLQKYKASVWNHPDIADGIEEFAKFEGADLIAVATHHKSLIRRLLEKSVSEKLVEQSSLPVLCLKIKEEQINQGVIFPQ